MWSLLKILAALPSDVVVRICLPILYLWRREMKGLAVTRPIIKARPNEPKIKIRWRTVSVIGKIVGSG